MRYLSLLSLLLILLVSACAKNRAPLQKDIVPPQHLAFDAPGWLWELPAGGYVIGITYADNFYSDGAVDFARDFAAVSLSRNHSSYIVDKEIVLSLAMQEEIDWAKISFNVVVSSDIGFLYRASAGLKMIDSYEINGYLIGLFGFIDGSVKPEKLSMNSTNIPDWSASHSVYTNGKTLYSVASSHQASLMDAWNMAQELALRQIAQYRLQNVVAVVRATNDIMQRNIAIETVTRSQNVYLDKSFIAPFKQDNIVSYKVFLQLKSVK
ncbi:MAG: hypothetical protein Q8M98_01040 [Candidatus Cloacimonadaceae bacterium]|nr:hypothetical protein [Candidatus Cloacimonadaceae bacterium]MDP3113335.1 hypothetical protein [Candidatus Cloacimonadaceae bacterium]